jgi:PAS domain S-box-containing protein
MMSEARNASKTRKTKEQLVKELAEARARIAVLEASEAERKRAAAEAQRRAAQAALVYEVGQRVSGELELEVLLSEIVTTVRDAFDYYNVMLELVDEEAQCMVVQSVAGVYADFFPDQHMAIGEGMTGYAAATGETQVSGDVSQDPHYIPDVEETKSELAAPIKSGKKVIGVLDLQSDEFDAFDETDVMLMETLADQIAVAIENARLYEAVQRELTERKQTEEALRAAQERFDLAVKGSSDGLWDRDVITDQEWWSPRYYELLGYEDGEFEATFEKFKELVHPEDADQAVEAERAHLEKRAPFDAQYRLLTKSGQYRWFRGRGQALWDENGNPIRIAGSIQDITERKQAEEALQKAYEEVEKQVEERTTELKREIAERERLQQEVIEAQKRTLQELSTPIIPVMDRIIIMPLIGSIDTMRAKDITRSLLAGIREHRAKVVILDITGVPIVDSGVASHLNKTIQAARLKGARTIVTGISDAVAETVVDLGIDWGGIETLSDLQTGLITALSSLGIKLTR